MRIARCKVQGRIIHAAISGEAGSEIVEELTGDPVAGDVADTGKSYPMAAATLLAPVTPSKIVCVAKNYAAHAAETGAEVPASPMLFLKPPSAVVGPNQPIVLPSYSSDVDHEVELAVVIGRAARNVAPEEALSYVFGYTVGNDVSARDVQKTEPQWVRAKAFDTSCPLGPWIVTGLDPADLALRCHVNGELRQDGTTCDLVVDVAHLIAFASTVMTLLPGDVVLTGTPAGVGPLTGGDTVVCSVEGIGELRNPVVAA
ncbi:MAG: fumarylacetoacetate hydrolase family protein [Propionibacteriaceae bacterium]|jgi:2-keto-4-pentenoate hydratase/2-oxohepta-3-ene-1,7-dioic acid hydratase in catechol pathway|nr:fumarylacetoacetate hydrolase family protein [Propionibacteriaceae bacterium]